MDHRELWAAELRLSCSEATVRAYTGALAELLRHASEDDPAQLVRGDVVEGWLFILFVVALIWYILDGSGD